MSWALRKKKASSMVKEKSIFELHSIPTNREISTLSKDGQRYRLQEIEDALVSADWNQKTRELHKQYIRAQVEKKMNHRLKFKSINAYVQAPVEYRRKSKQIWSKLSMASHDSPTKLSNLIPSRYYIVECFLPQNTPKWKMG